MSATGTIAMPVFVGVLEKLGATGAERFPAAPLPKNRLSLNSVSPFELLRRPGVSYAELMSLPGAGSAAVDVRVAEQVEIATKYAGYIERQHDEIARNASQEAQELPGDLDYRTVRGLSSEVQQKLNQHRPEAHAAMKATYAAGDENQQALAIWMDRLGMGG